MSYNGTCLCGDVKFNFEYDPMMQFQCHCNICQKVFGTTLNGLVIPEDELTCEGEISKFTISGGSGNDLNYHYCPRCSVIIYNKPNLFDGLIYLPAGLLADQIQFKPTVELWTENKAEWLAQAKTIKNSFKDNATVERLGELLENLEQRQ